MDQPQKKAKKNSTPVALPAMFASILKSHSELPLDTYHLGDHPIHTPVAAPVKSQNAEDFIAHCEKKAVHELNCYLLCVYEKIRAELPSGDAVK
jgi:hypothetical protein